MSDYSELLCVYLHSSANICLFCSDIRSDFGNDVDVDGLVGPVTHVPLQLCVLGQCNNESSMNNNNKSKDNVTVILTLKKCQIYLNSDINILISCKIASACNCRMVSPYFPQIGASPIKTGIHYGYMTFIWQTLV